MNSTSSDIPNFGDPSEPLGDPPGEPEAPEIPVSAPAWVASARNAVKDGFRSEKYFPYDLETIIKRCLATLLDEFQPTTDYHTMLVVEMAKADGKLEKAAAMEIADLIRIQNEATTEWDSSRREFVDKLGKRLEKDPGPVKRALERTKQGTDWLTERWTRLARIVANLESIGNDQRAMMFDLLGVEPELREGNPEVPEASDRPALAALCQRELDRLERLRQNGLLAKDEQYRTMAAAGMPLDVDAKTRLHWTYAAAARRVRNEARRLLLEGRSEPARPGPKPPPAPGPEPAPRREWRHTFRLAPKPEPELPPSPVMSDADCARIARQAIEAGIQIQALEHEARKAAAAAEPTAEPAATDAAPVPPEPAVAPVLRTSPAAIMDRAAEATKKRLEKAQRKKCEDDERRRRRNQQKESRKGGRRKR